MLRHLYIAMGLLICTIVVPLPLLCQSSGKLMFLDLPDEELPISIPSDHQTRLTLKVYNTASTPSGDFQVSLTFSGAVTSQVPCFRENEDGSETCVMSLESLDPYRSTTVHFYFTPHFGYSEFWVRLLRAPAGTMTPEVEAETHFRLKGISNFGSVDLVLRLLEAPEEVEAGSEANFVLELRHDRAFLNQRDALTVDLRGTLKNGEVRSISSPCTYGRLGFHCGFGSFPAGTRRKIQITMVPEEPGLFEWSASVTCRWEDFFKPDNSLTVVRTAAPANVLPVVEVNPELTAVAGELVNLVAQTSDADGDELEISWTQIAGTSVELLAPDSASVVFRAPWTASPRELGFRVDVSDGTGVVSREVTVTVQPYQLYFPIFGAGSVESLRFQSQLEMVNTSGAGTPVRIEFLNSSGQAQEVDLGDLGNRNSLLEELDAGATLDIVVEPTGDLVTGYVRLTTSLGVDGLEIFSRFDGESGALLYEAGVPPSSPVSSFTLYVDSRGDRATGLALLNPKDSADPEPAESASITLRLYDSSFHFLDESTITLEAGKQISLQVSEIFPQATSGVITVDSDQPLSALTLLQRLPRLPFPAAVPTLTVLPVIPGTGNASLQQALSPP